MLTAEKKTAHASGQVREVGRHDELMRLAEGQYRGLVEVEERLAAGGGGRS